MKQDEPKREQVLHLTPQQLTQLRDAMKAVVASGTARQSQIRGATLAGKTGTAQNSQDPNRHHAWFVGFAPADKPEIVVAVMLEFGGHGTAAAQVASKIIARYLRVAAVGEIQTEG